MSFLAADGSSALAIVCVDGPTPETAIPGVSDVLYPSKPLGLGPARSDLASVRSSAARLLASGQARFALICSLKQYELIDKTVLAHAINRMRSGELVRIGIQSLAGTKSKESLGGIHGLYDFAAYPKPLPRSWHKLAQLLKSVPSSSIVLKRCALICDPSLKSSAGHHLGVANSLVRAATKSGMTPFVTVNRDSAIRCLPRSEATYALFSDYLYENNTSPASFIVELDSAARRVGLVDGDVITLFCASPPMLLGALVWLSGRNEKLRPTIVIRFDRPHWRTPHGGLRYADVFDMIHSHNLRAKFKFFVESVNLQRYFRIESGEVFPLLFNPVAPPLKIRNKPPNVITISYIGEAREEKGFGLLPAVVEDLLSNAASEKTLQFRIQASANPWNRTDQIKVAVSNLRKLAQVFVGQIEIIETQLSDRQYRTLIASSDIILLPYSPVQYKIRGSGIATECAFLNKIMVAPECLDLAKTFAGQRLISCAEFSTKQFIVAAKKAIRKIERGSQTEVFNLHHEPKSSFARMVFERDDLQL